jgi:hypothetical protein
MSDEEMVAIKLSREDLYELVWSKPIRELAKDFGISDVALAKRCRRLRVPVPGRGYWARVDAGQSLHRPQLQKREPQRLDASALAVGPPPERLGANSPSDQADEALGSHETPPASEQDDAWLKDRIAYEEHPDNAIAVPASTRNWDSAIQRCREDLEEAAGTLRAAKRAAEKAEKWPAWRKRTDRDDEGWAWRMVKDRGQRIWDAHEAVCFRVSLGTYKRALSIVNALALAAQARGFAVREDETEGRIVFSGHNAEIRLRVTELLELKTRPRTGYQGKVEQERYYAPTRWLRIALQIDYRAGPIFEDRHSRPLELQLNKVFCGIYRLVVKAWREERRHQARQRELEEEARLRAEAARIEADRERALAEARRHRRRLVSEANRWAQSKRIRDYVAHIRTAAGEGPEAPDSLTGWAEWALGVASTLDPTERRLGQADQGAARQSHDST